MSAEDRRRLEELWAENDARLNPDPKIKRSLTPEDLETGAWRGQFDEAEEDLRQLREKFNALPRKFYKLPVIEASDHPPEAAPFPMPEKDYYPQVNRDGLKRLTVNGEIWGPLQGHTGVDWTTGNEAGIEHLRKAVRKAEREAKLWRRTTVLVSLMGAASWTLALATHFGGA